MPSCPNCDATIDVTRDRVSETKLRCGACGVSLTVRMKKPTEKPSRSAKAPTETPPPQTPPVAPPPADTDDDWLDDLDEPDRFGGPDADSLNPADEADESDLFDEPPPPQTRRRPKAAPNPKRPPAARAELGRQNHRELLLGGAAIVAVAALTVGGLMLSGKRPAGGGGVSVTPATGPDLPGVAIETVGEATRVTGLPPRPGADVPEREFEDRPNAAVMMQESPRYQLPMGQREWLRSMPPPMRPTEPGWEPISIPPADAITPTARASYDSWTPAADLRITHPEEAGVVLADRGGRFAVVGTTPPPPSPAIRQMRERRGEAVPEPQPSRVIDLSTGEPVGTFAAEADITQARLSPDGRLLVAAMWRTDAAEAQKPRREITLHVWRRDAKKPSAAITLADAAVTWFGFVHPTRLLLSRQPAKTSPDVRNPSVTVALYDLDEADGTLEPRATVSMPLAQVAIEMGPMPAFASTTFLPAAVSASGRLAAFPTAGRRGLTLVELFSGEAEPLRVIGEFALPIDDQLTPLVAKGMFPGSLGFTDGDRVLAAVLNTQVVGWQVIDGRVRLMPPSLADQRRPFKLRGISGPMRPTPSDRLRLIVPTREQDGRRDARLVDLQFQMQPETVGEVVRADAERLLFRGTRPDDGGPGLWSEPTPNDLAAALAWPSSLGDRDPVEVLATDAPAADDLADGERAGDVWEWDPDGLAEPPPDSFVPARDIRIEAASLPDGPWPACWSRGQGHAFAVAADGSVTWQRIDLAGGQPIGEPVALPIPNNQPPLTAASTAETMAAMPTMASVRPDGSMLVMARPSAANTLIDLFDGDGRLLRTVRTGTPYDTVEAIRWLADDLVLIATRHNAGPGDEDSGPSLVTARVAEAILYRLPDWTPVWRQPGDPHAPVAIAPSGRWMAIASEQGVGLIETATGRVVERLEASGPLAAASVDGRPVEQERSDSVSAPVPLAVAIAPDESSVAVRMAPHGATGLYTFLFDLSDGQGMRIDRAAVVQEAVRRRGNKLAELKPEPEAGVGVTQAEIGYFAPNGLLTASPTRAIAFDLDAGRQVGRTDELRTDQTALRVSPDGRAWLRTADGWSVQDWSVADDPLAALAETVQPRPDRVFEVSPLERLFGPDEVPIAVEAEVFSGAIDTAGAERRVAQQFAAFLRDAGRTIGPGGATLRLIGHIEKADIITGIRGRNSKRIDEPHVRWTLTAIPADGEPNEFAEAIGRFDGKSSRYLKSLQMPSRDEIVYEWDFPIRPWDAIAAEILDDAAALDPGALLGWESGRVYRVREVPRLPTDATR